MSHIRIDKQKAVKKWSPVLENMGVTGDRVEWMSELAEFHSINENAYANATTAGMGGVTNPVLSTFPGLAGGGFGSSLSPSLGSQVGSGDLGQNLLPVAMKIAAQTIGLDLVAVKPTPGPKIDLLYIDFQYDDLTSPDNGRPQVFKMDTIGGVSGASATASAVLQAVLQTAPLRQTQGGFDGGRVFTRINTTAVPEVTTGAEAAGSSKAGLLEFLGFSRVDGKPMFKAYRQSNATGQSVGGSVGYPFVFDQTLNTFNPTASMTSQITHVAGVTASCTIELISALEDHLPGFSANWATKTSSGDYPMGRQQDDDTYSGVIGPKISSKSVAVGTIEVSTALRRTEIEDIKANTGMDIVQKMESILVNELSQTISRQIVKRIFELGDTNRQTAPAYGGSASFGAGLIPAVNGGVASIFDLDTSYVNANGGIGGETTHAVQRKLITKMAHASNYIATEGRVGPAQYAITNGGLAAALMDIAGYTVNPVKSKLNSQGQLYPVGTIGDMQIYVDPYQRYNDNRIVIGRKNNPDQPGLIFVPYLMAQSISVISEATFAPRMLLRSRYAITDVGFFPEKQFMTMYVVDQQQFLN
jgi:hypothetical protein